MPRPLLSARGIVRTIGPRTILRDISLAVDDRSAVALVGPNGSGKSTLLRIFAGELDPHTGEASEYAGSWAAYETERERARRRAGEAHDRAAAERERLHARELTMRARIAGVRRRASVETDKHVRRAMRQSAQRSADGLAAQLARRAERIEVPDAPWERAAPALPFVSGGSRAGVVAALEGAVLRRGAFTLGPLDLEVRDGDRVLLAGPNGCGKSTVIAALGGPLEPCPRPRPPGRWRRRRGRPGARAAACAGERRCGRRGAGARGPR